MSKENADNKQSQELTLLKAQAYDCLAAIEHYQKQLQIINQKIAEFNEQKKVPTK